MELALELRLPNDEATLPVVRHLARAVLRELGVPEDATCDVELAVGEACANVVRHSATPDVYQVELCLQPPRCTVRVVDHGRGFRPEAIPAGQPPPAAEHGRGIAIMRDLVDRIELVSHPEGGTVVCLDKRLDWEPPGDSALPRGRRGAGAPDLVG